MATHHPIRKHVPAPEIPDKLYFRIGDVAKLCEVPAYVLRFWETEFPQLKPNKGGTGQRLYRRKDVEMALRIKSLLYDQGYTIPGARQVFKSEARAKETAAFPAPEPVVPPAEADESAAVTPFVREKLAPVAHAGDAQSLQQDRVLAALRAELKYLQSMLGKAPSGAHPPVSAADEPSRVKTMRPRLAVVEPLPPRPKPEKPGPRILPRTPLAQPGLFGGFDDDGPMAS